MSELTKRQRQVLGFIQECQRAGGVAPSLREIAAHFGFSSMTTAMDHVRLLRKKGVLEHRPGRARSLRVVSPLHKLRRQVADIRSMAPSRPASRRTVAGSQGLCFH